MIDLRSDTLTIPDRSMLETILTAPLGGMMAAWMLRVAEKTLPSTNWKICPLPWWANKPVCYALPVLWATRLPYSPGAALEIRYWSMTCSISTAAKNGLRSSFWTNEKAVYHLDENFQPATEEIEDQFRTGSIKLLCLENTHNYTGGTCITEASLKKIYDLAQKYYIPVHMDGARLFNAALYLKVPVSQLCQYVDSVQFCFSKGLGAPVGSVLCGSKEFIKAAKETRKLMGGAMRQAGIIAAPPSMPWNITFPVCRKTMTIAPPVQPSYKI